MWEFVIETMSGENIKMFYEIKKMRLVDVLDYMVIKKQKQQIEEWRSSKNSIAI